MAAMDAFSNAAPPEEAARLDERLAAADARLADLGSALADLGRYERERDSDGPRRLPPPEPYRSAAVGLALRRASLPRERGPPTRPGGCCPQRVDALAGCETRQHARVRHAGR